MRPIKFAWLLIALCVLMSLSFVFASRSAHADQSPPPNLSARLGVALRALPTYKDDIAPELADAKSEQLDALSTAIASATPSREWAALLATVAYSESGLSLRLFRGECRPHECDSHLVDGRRVFRAWSPWQIWANKLNESVWGSQDLTVQASEAARMLKRSFYTCQPKGAPLRQDWVARTLTAFGGRRCDAQWPGLAPRLATYAKIVGRL